MTDAELAAKANAGDRAAMNALLARHDRAVGSIVFRALRQTRRAFDVYDDALQAGREALWRCVRSWDPERAPLMVFAWKPIEREAWDVAARMGHAVKARFGVRSPRPPVCLDAPIGDDPNAPAVVTLLSSPPHDIGAAADVERVLSQMRPEEAEIIRRIAGGDRDSEIAEERGVSRQCIQQFHARALKRAGRIANGVIRRAA